MNHTVVSEVQTEYLHGFIDPGLHKVRVYTVYSMVLCLLTRFLQCAAHLVLITTKM